MGTDAASEPAGGRSPRSEILVSAPRLTGWRRNAFRLTDVGSGGDAARRLDRSNMPGQQHLDVSERVGLRQLLEDQAQIRVSLMLLSPCDIGDDQVAQFCDETVYAALRMDRANIVPDMHQQAAGREHVFDRLSQRDGCN